MKTFTSFSDQQQYGQVQKDSDGDHNIATGAFSFRAATAPSR